MVPSSQTIFRHLPKWFSAIFPNKNTPNSQIVAKLFAYIKKSSTFAAELVIFDYLPYGQLLANQQTTGYDERF